MVVSFGKAFLEDKHVWFAESLLGKISAFFSSNTIPVDGMNLKNLMFKDIEKTFDSAQ
jgi:hypothetical protein